MHGWISKAWAGQATYVHNTILKSDDETVLGIVFVMYLVDLLL